MTLLAVSDLSVAFATRSGSVSAVDGVSFTVSRGEALGIVGESGSGKSITALSIMGLIDPPGRIAGGSVKFDGSELVGMAEGGLRKLRGRRIAMIFQDPMMTLNPVLTIGAQMTEAILSHERVPMAEARARARDALGKVGLPSPEERLDAYPHQLSGGMRQRVVIATALLNSPDLIIADEPTTALDVTIQSQILYEIKSLCAASGTALIWISHDLSVVGALAHRTMVMYAGRVVEIGDTEAVIDRSLHPYTRGLLGSLPLNNERGSKLAQIPGTLPRPGSQREGCVFRPRCFRASDRCASPPPRFEGAGAAAYCHFPLAGEPR
jgi:peptide/nickel transport system ATP-binding protein